ncbi:hypothetical protein T4B_3943 [Trichinella pseudospiralis]|uniref:Uncharacterized protein n=1 Tax=Trichinella pseudospiralis TaxID=6337 RepID=A0A0V1IKB2_TRIPS|nr:hypothetical protein T4B_3943 [Trichinella pseudospiralis]
MTLKSTNGLLYYKRKHNQTCRTNFNISTSNTHTHTPKELKFDNVNLARAFMHTNCTNNQAESTFFNFTHLSLLSLTGNLFKKISYHAKATIIIKQGGKPLCVIGCLLIEITVLLNK